MRGDGVALHVQVIREDTPLSSLTAPNMAELVMFGQPSAQKEVLPGRQPCDTLSAMLPQE